MIISEFLLIRILLFEIILKYNLLRKPLEAYNDVSNKNSKIVGSIFYHIIMSYLKANIPYIENN